MVCWQEGIGKPFPGYDRGWGAGRRPAAYCAALYDGLCLVVEYQGVNRDLDDSWGCAIMENQVVRLVRQRGALGVLWRFRL